MIKIGDILIVSYNNSNVYVMVTEILELQISSITTYKGLMYNCKILNTDPNEPMVTIQIKPSDIKYSYSQN